MQGADMHDADRRDAGRRRKGARRWRHRFTVVEAMILLAFFGMAQRLIPMRWWARTLGRPASPPAPWLGTRTTRLPVQAGSWEEFAVARAIRRANSTLPWTPTCLAEAATGQVLLRRRGSAGVVVIGLRPPDSGVNAATPSETSTISHPPSWDAHAWLMGQRGALTGGPAARGFTATTVYEVAGRLTSTDVILGISTGESSDP